MPKNYKLSEKKTVSTREKTKNNKISKTELQKSEERCSTLSAKTETTRNTEAVIKIENDYDYE